MLGAGILLCVAVTCPGADRPIWLAISRPGLVEAIKPLAAHRRGEGFEAIVSAEPVAKAIASSPRRPAFVLLVGDDRPGGEAEPWCVPAKRMELYRWRASQRRQFASDAAWGDFDGDLAPDVPVGRIPARTAKQVEAVVAKTFAYERRPPTSADLGLVAWAGSPGYGKTVDALVTGMGLSTFRSNAPLWAQPWAILGSAAHPLCGWPPEQPERFARRLRQGGLLAVLIGHAGATSFFSMRHVGRGVWLRASDVQSAWAKGPPGPPAMLITCNCGRFDADVPCLAESLLMMPAGPVVTVGATTESHPLTNYYTSVALLKQLGGPQRRVGEVWLAAQRKARKARSFFWERILRDVEGKLEESIDVAKLRRDQPLMYAMLGDPAVRMKLPEPLKIAVERKEDGWHWRADRPDGAVRLHVARRPAKWALPPARADRSREQAEADFEKALASAAFRPVAELPAAAEWSGVVKQPGVLRLVATGKGRLWAAAAKLTAPATQPKPKAKAGADESACAERRCLRSREAAREVSRGRSPREPSVVPVGPAGVRECPGLLRVCRLGRSLPFRDRFGARTRRACPEAAPPANLQAPLRGVSAELPSDRRGIGKSPVAAPTGRAPSGATHGRSERCAAPEGAGLFVGRCHFPTAAAVGSDVPPSGLSRESDCLSAGIARWGTSREGAR